MTMVEDMERKEKKMSDTTDQLAGRLGILTFEQLRATNVARCEDVFHKLEDWTLTDWATAMAGECGEACNKIKKFRRGDLVDRKEIADEIADLVIYADLLAARAGIDLGEAVRRKFNEVSAKRASRFLL